MVGVPLREATRRELVKVLLDFILLGKCLRLVPEIDSRLRVAFDLIFLDLWVGAAAARDTTSLIVLNRIAIDERRGVEHDDSVCVVDDDVSDNPGKPTLYYKDTLGATLANFVSNDDCVSTGSAAKCKICFVVLRYFVSFDMRIGRFNEEDTLAEIQ